MKLIQRVDNLMGLFGLQPKAATKNSKAPALPDWWRTIGEQGAWGEGVPDAEIYKNQAERYISSPAFYAGVNRIAEAGAMTQIKVFAGPEDDAKEINPHPFIDLLKRPAPNMEWLSLDRFTLIESILASLAITGNSYLYLGGRSAPTQAPTMLLPLRPDRLTVLPDKEVGVKGYKYLVGSQEWQIAVADIVHIRRFHPLNDFVGLSQTEPANYALATDFAAQQHNWATFKNSARLSVVIESDAQHIDPADKEMMEQYWRDTYTGDPAKAHQVAFLWGGFQAKDFGQNMRDAEYIQGRKLNRSDILMTLGIHPGLLMAEDINLANSKTAEYLFAKYTLLPLVSRIIFRLNAEILPLYGEGQEVRAIDVVPRDEIYNAQVAATQAGAAKTLIDALGAKEGIAEAKRQKLLSAEVPEPKDEPPPAPAAPEQKPPVPPEEKPDAPKPPEEPKPEPPKLLAPTEAIDLAAVAEQFARAAEALAEAKFNPYHAPPGSDAGGQFTSAQQAGPGSSFPDWTATPRTASELHGKIPLESDGSTVPMRTIKRYHVTRVENLPSLMDKGFDLERVKPRWANDFAVSLSGAPSLKKAMGYFTETTPGARMDTSKYAVVEVTVKGRFFKDSWKLQWASDEVRNSKEVAAARRAGKTPDEVTKISARAYTRAVTGEGWDGFDQGNAVYVYNPQAISRIHVVPLDEMQAAQKAANLPAPTAARMGNAKELPDADDAETLWAAHPDLTWAQVKAELLNADLPEPTPAPPAATHGFTTAMLAFFPTVTRPMLSDLPDGSEPVPDADLHVTLAFLGDTAALELSATEIALRVEQAAAQLPVLTGKFGGAVTFTSADGQQPFCATIDAPALQAWRAALLRLTGLDAYADDTHGYTPHMTLAYLPIGTQPPTMTAPDGEIVFDAVTLAWDDERYTFPLLGGPVADAGALEALGKFNAYHKPAGPGGGQFTSGTNAPDGTIRSQGGRITVLGASGEGPDEKPADWDKPATAGADAAIAGLAKTRTPT